MRKSTRRIILVIATVVVLLVLVPTGVWLSLTHEPTFYRTLVETPIAHAEEEAKRFEQDSLQLRNDIVNEPTWEGVFSDQEVNAWLAEGLVKHFADELPKEIHDPRVVFDNDRVTIAFKFDQGSITTVVTLVTRITVPEDNVVAFTVEAVRAGALPIPPEKFIAPLKKQADSHGLEMTWQEVDGMPVARIAYRPQKDRKDVVLERVQVAKGQMRLSGRSTREAGPVATPKLPDRRTLQLQLPRRKTQADAPVDPNSPSEVVRSESSPVR